MRRLSLQGEGEGEGGREERKGQGKSNGDEGERQRQTRNEGEEDGSNEQRVEAPTLAGDAVTCGCCLAGGSLRSSSLLLLL